MKGYEMSDNKFHVIFLALAAAVLITLISLGFGSGMYADYVTLKMVESGADPIKARCAVHGSGERNAALCVLAVQKP